METTKGVQYVLVGFQFLVLGWFAVSAFVHVANGSAFDATAISPDWFNPFAVDSFSSFAAGVSLSIFIYWGWDVTLTMNEETRNPEKTPGRAATVTVVVIMAIYMLVALATLSFAGVGETGLGAGNPENQSSIFAVLAGPVMGPFAILMSLAILSSSAASLQSTFVSPARTLLAMGHYKALPRGSARSARRYKSPSYATVAAAVAAAGFYVITRTTSENALWDTITALGMMICFYYGITALACVWFFRAWPSASPGLLFQVPGTAAGRGHPAGHVRQDGLRLHGSGVRLGIVRGRRGLVFVLGMGVILLGVVAMLVMARIRPEFFKGQVLARGRPDQAAAGGSALGRSATGRRRPRSYHNRVVRVGRVSRSPNRSDLNGDRPEQNEVNSMPETANISKVTDIINDSQSGCSPPSTKKARWSAGRWPSRK